MDAKRVINIAGVRQREDRRPRRETCPSTILPTEKSQRLKMLLYLYRARNTITRLSIPTQH